MSFPGTNAHGAYYHLSSSQAAQQSYGSGAGIQGNSSSSYPERTSYQNDGRQSQYVTQGYNWSAQNPQSYGESGDQTDGNEAWRNTSGQERKYDYQRQYQRSSTGIPAIPQSNIVAQTYDDSTATASKAKSTQGLNSLAYASGLESAGIQGSAKTTSLYPGASASLSSFSRSQDANTHRTSSAAQTSSQQYSARAQQAFHSQTEQVLSSHPLLVTSVATALAGAVSRRQQVAQLTPWQKPTSPNMGNAASNISSRQQKGSSLYNDQPVAHTRQSSSQNKVDQTANAAPEKSNLALSQRRSFDTSQHETSQIQYKNTSAQSNGDIANLVTSEPTQFQAQPVENSQTQSPEVPHYIDPRQIFNHYHKEHERKRHEAAALVAAEVEAEAEAEPQNQEAEAKNRDVEATVTKQNEAARAAQQSDSRTTDSVQPQQQSQPQSQLEIIGKQKSQQAEGSEIPDAGPPDARVAAELKAMVDTMKNLKSKDPELFQKLWEDIKQPVPLARNAAQSTSPRTREPPRPQSAPKSRQLQRGDVGALQGQTGFSTLPNYVHVVVEDNAEQLPDLGRFPAERHIRTSNTTREKLMPSGIPRQATSQSPQAITQHNSATRSTTKGTATTKPSQPLPPRKEAGTIWPESKRNALAEAAVRALNIDPTNRQIGVTAQEICKMLEQNPSYLDLCTMLENRGLKFHRGRFARYLLSNVPDLSGHQQYQAKGAQKSPAIGAHPVGSTISPPPHQFASPVQTMQVVGAGPFLQQGTEPSTQVKPDIQSQTTAFASLTAVPYAAPPPRYPQSVPKSKLRFSVPGPPVPSPKPGSKEVMARKRDFSELVDLTQLSDSEDYVMPSKKPRVESHSPELDPFAAYEQSSQPPHVATSGHSPAFIALQNSSFSLLPSNTAPMKLNSSAMPPPAHVQGRSQTPPPARAIMAKPLNKREALRKSYYDPKTLARDILIATGKHPTERPLNTHMAGLLGVHIDMNSDLSSFDWDAIDPGGPKPPSLELVDIPAGPPKWKLGDRKRHRERQTAEGQGNPPLDSHPSPTGADAKSYAKPGPASPPASTLISRFSAQTRQLLKDSLKPSKEFSDNTPQPKESQVPDEVPAERNIRVVTPPKRKVGLCVSIPSSHPSHSGPKSSRESSTTQTTTMEGQKRRGRPPGAKNKYPSVPTVTKATKPQIATPVTLPSPTFAVYKCRWRSCNTQLHNISTLRAHVAKVHRPSPPAASEHGYICWWRRCSLHKNTNDGSIVPTKIFKTQSDWLAHIEEQHIHPTAMKYGDGPSTTHIGKPKSSLDVSKFLYVPSHETLARTISYLDPQTIARDKIRYLSDELERTITPNASSAANDDVPGDVMTLAKASKDPDDLFQIKAFMRAHGNEKMDVKKSAEETLRAMEARKEKVGPGLDRGGCTLVTDARRATLVQDADIARVIEFDYE